MGNDITELIGKAANQYTKRIEKYIKDTWEKAVPKDDDWTDEDSRDMVQLAVENINLYRCFY